MKIECGTAKREKKEKRKRKTEMGKGDVYLFILFHIILFYSSLFFHSHSLSLLLF